MDSKSDKICYYIMFTSNVVVMNEFKHVLSQIETVKVDSTTPPAFSLGYALGR